MDAANHKRRGFLKNMLVKPFSRLTNQFPPAHGGGSKVKPSPPAARDSPGGYYSTTRRSVSGHSAIPPVQVGSTVKANHVRGLSVGYVQQNSYHGDDENVDSKAASYIYNVRERFRSHESVRSDQAYYPEML
ncbi:hypothetical protein ACJRO7_012711 [Eucalyptus globulus]|uniref:Uncharacterized protein n=1 Tax=Eucalyptus globulus TaxID=34317 RepID=A0ABD3LQ38_EUCGL